MQNIVEEPLAQINSHTFAKEFDVLTSLPRPLPRPLPSLFAEFHPELPQSGEVQSYLDSHSGLPQKAPASQKIPLSKGKEKVDFYGGEKTVVATGGLLCVSEIPGEEVRKRGCVRTRDIDPQAKKNALQVWKSRACWNCWVLKVHARLSGHFDFHTQKLIVCVSAQRGKYVLDVNTRSNPPSWDMYCAPDWQLETMILFFSQVRFVSIIITKC